MANEICHFEVRALDTKVSSDFYAKVFGWEIAPMEGMPTYALTKAGEGVGGAISQEMYEGANIMLYVHAEDIEAKLKEIEAAGGKVVMPKTKISDEMGYFAFFTDPGGTPMGLFSEK